MGLGCRRCPHQPAQTQIVVMSGKLASDNGFGTAWDGSDTKALMAAIEQVVANPAVFKGISLRAHEYYEQHFVAGKVYSRYVEFLGSLSRPLR